MSAGCFITWTGTTSALTAPMTGVATNTAVTAKTLLQLHAPSASKIRIIEWGYRFFATPTVPIQMELLETGTVAATVTAGNIANYNDITGPASMSQAAGYNSTAEGTITASRLLGQTLDLGTYFSQQFPLGREPEIGANNYLRLRATPSVALTAALSVAGYFVWEE